MTLINGLEQGADVRQHLGRRSCIKGLHIRGFIQNVNASVAGVEQMLRLLVVYDRQPNGATPPIGEILQNTNVVGYTNMSFMNINNTKRFLVLGSKKWFQARNFGVNQPPFGILETTERMLEMTIPYRKIKNLVTEYTGGSTATVADITTGAIFLIAIGAQNDGFRFVWNARYRFCDV